MQNTRVRILAIKLEGFKNTISGIVELPSFQRKDFFSRKSDILGIYGQNGSGKTAIVEALSMVQTLLMGDSLSEDSLQCVSMETGICTISIAFAIDSHEVKAKVDYSVTFCRNTDERYDVNSEILDVALETKGEFQKKKTLLRVDHKNGDIEFGPQYRYREIVRESREDKIELGVATRIALNERRSFIFNKTSCDILLSHFKDTNTDYRIIMKALYRYATLNLFVIKNDRSGGISMNLILPLAFRIEANDIITKGDLPIRLDGPSLISKKKYDITVEIIRGMNIVLQTIIPGLSIDIHEYGQELLRDNTVGYKIQLVSKRGKIVIPLKYESEGILKIISILNALMCAYSNPSMCLVIDELDSGVYEYLLGEILLTFSQSGKGQLIFTSHNLRPLELLDKTSILYSTTNPQNRYIRFQNVKTNNNMRDMYLRSITLGGQKELIYEETDRIEIARALRCAERAVQYDEKN